MRSCRPTRGPTSKPVLVGATTASSIERAGRRLRPEKKPVRAGASPAGQSSNGTVDVASPEGVGRRRRPCGGVATICHIHDTTSSGRCGRARGSSSPARKRVTKVDRQGVVAGDRSRVTACSSRLAERRPSVGEVALSHLVAVGVSSSPANIGSFFRGRAAAAAPPSRRLCHAWSSGAGVDAVVTALALIRPELQLAPRATAGPSRVYAAGLGVHD